MESPAGELVERHEVDLTGGAGAYGGEEDLVVAFAQELEALDALVHEHAVELARLDVAYLDGFVAPAHDLAAVGDVGDGGGHLAPLQHALLHPLAVRVHVDALVVVAEEQVHAAAVGQHDNGVRHDERVGGGQARHVDVEDGARVELDGVEARGRAVEHLHALLLLDGQVDQQRLVLQIGKRLERHELAVGLLRPRVHLVEHTQT